MDLPHGLWNSMAGFFGSRSPLRIPPGPLQSLGPGAMRAALAFVWSTFNRGPGDSGDHGEHLSKALATIAAESARYKQQGKPWINEKGEVIWPWLRVWVACIVRNQMFETLMGVVILANVALIVYETNADAACYPEFLGDLASCPHASGKIVWTFVSNVVLQVIYTAECAARGYVERADFFRNRWNLLDLFIATGCRRYFFFSFSPYMFIQRCAVL
eukprot:s261_g17.t1